MGRRLEKTAVKLAYWLVKRWNYVIIPGDVVAEVETAYCDVTHGRFSKINTRAHYIVSAAEQITMDCVQEALEEAGV